MQQATLPLLFELKILPRSVPFIQMLVFWLTHWARLAEGGTLPQ